METKKIIERGIFIGITAVLFESLNLGGHLEPIIVYPFGVKATSGLDMTPFYNSIKMWLKYPEAIFGILQEITFIKTSIFELLQKFFDISGGHYLKGILYTTLFTFYFSLFFLFGSIAAKFSAEKESRLFIMLQFLLYFIIMKFF